MEIKNNNISFNPYSASLDKSGAAKGAQRSSTTEAATQSAGDRVSVSPEARLRTEAFSTAMSTADIRTEKVAALKAQVQAGTYTPDSSAIASKMLQEEPGLFRS